MTNSLTVVAKVVLDTSIFLLQKCELLTFFYQKNINVQMQYSRLLLFRSPRDPLKYVEISVPRHIRFAELKNKSNNHF